MFAIRKATRWLGVLAFAACVALMPESAEASFIMGGSTFPSNSSASGYVDVQVYNRSGGAADPFGIGLSAGALQSLGFSGADVDQFLYLYRTVNVGTDIFQNTIQSSPTVNHGAGNLVGITFATLSNPIASSANGGPPVAGDDFALFRQELNPTGIVAGGFAPTSIVQGALSLIVTYTPNLAPAGSFSSLWGYTSNLGPISVTTSIQDGGLSATGITLGTSQPQTTVPEPSSIFTAGLGIAAL
jgi:hypothetical protein